MEIKKTSTHTCINSITVIYLLSFTIVSGAAEFQLNFNRIPELPGSSPTQLMMSCDAGSTSGCAGNDGTAFSQESLTIDGVSYWRNVIGEPATGFAMEYYTRQPGSRNFFGGGMERSKHDSKVSGCIGTQNSGPLINCKQPDEPFGVFTLNGNGTTDPDKTIFRMVLDQGDGITQEVFKPLLGTKPKITQTLTDGDLRTEFIVDMRGLTYNDKDTAAVVINNQAIDDSGLPAAGIADFDMSRVDRSEVVAGRYTFSEGQGWGVDVGAGWQASAGASWQTANSAYDYGTYTYEGSNFDVYNVDWGQFFNYADNVAPCTSGLRLAISCPGGP